MKPRTLLLLALVAVPAALWGWRAYHQPGKSDIPALEALLDFAQARKIAGYAATETWQSLTLPDKRLCESDGQVCGPQGNTDFDAFDPDSRALHAGLGQRIRELGLAVDTVHIQYDKTGAVREAQLGIANRHLLWYVYSPGQPWVSSHPQLAATHVAGAWYLEEDTDWN